MKKIYGVPYIEVEFGQRPFGWRLFSDIETCRKKVKEDRKNATSNGQYLGPQIIDSQLVYYEIPFDCLPKDCQKALRVKGFSATEDRWRPEFKSDAKSI